jgi:sodium/bile acid cotransporter 7
MPATPSPASAPAHTRVHWIRANAFILGITLAVFFAFFYPGPGSRHGSLHAEILTNAGIALILFLQGLSLAYEKIKSGAGNWRLHAVIQSFTFVLFPLAGLGLYALFPWIWPDAPASLRQGFLFLCVLPSTISTSVVLTSVAGGNTPGALFNAAFSNILGVIATPILVQLLMRAAGSGSGGSFGPLLLKISLLTLLPFALGMALRPAAKDWIEARKRWIARISNIIILFIVYAAFCDSVQERIWERHGLALTAKAFLGVLLLFLGMSALIYGSIRLLRLSREDAIAAYFCSVKKTLALGVPLALLIFGESSDLPLLLLPLLFYHPLQLLLNGILANQWAKRRENAGI